MSNALTLLGAVALFAAVSSALFFLPGWEVVLYPLYGLIFLWNDHRHDDEMYIIFVFLATAAAFLLMARETAAPARAGLAVEALGVWILCFGIGYHRGMLGAARTAAFAETDKLEAVAKDAERELKFYGTYEASAVAQIRLRRDLTQAAKSLGTTMDADEVQRRLVRIVEAAQGHQGGRPSGTPRTRWSTGRSRPRPRCWCGHEGRGPLRAAPAAPFRSLWSSSRWPRSPTASCASTPRPRRLYRRRPAHRGPLRDPGLDDLGEHPPLRGGPPARHPDGLTQLVTSARSI